MFTGLIQSLGTVVAIESLDHAARLTIDGGALVRECKVGDSLAVNGVCLTATAIAGTRFSATAIEETLRRTTLVDLRAGSRVNLELPLRPIDRIGGHFVQGHVDGKASVAAIEDQSEGVRVSLCVPNSLSRYLAAQGSVAIDGVSLTIAAAQIDGCSIVLIPHTRAVTTLGELRVGDEVNLEVDVLAKYVERLRTSDFAASPSLTEARLRELGY